MCVALPGTVLSVDGDTAEVDFHGNRVKARGAQFVSVVPGDRVLVHAGCILQKVEEPEDDDLEKLMQEVGAY